MADDYRRRCADAAMNAWSMHAVLCDHSQTIPIGSIVNAVLAERDDQLEQLRAERDQAIAHDRQPYPTQWAYDQACAALETHRARADTAEAEVARLRAGEADELPPPGTNYTPAQWIRRWNQATPEERLARAEHILADAVTASRCLAMDHAAELDHLRRIQQRARAVAESWRAAGMRRADDSGDSVWVAMAHVCAQVLAALDGDVDVTDADGEPVGGDGRG